MCGKPQRLLGKGLSRAWIPILLLLLCLSPGKSDDLSPQDVNNREVNPNATVQNILVPSAWDINSKSSVQSINLAPTLSMTAPLPGQASLPVSVSITPTASLSPLQTIEAQVTGLSVSTENNPIINEDQSASNGLSDVQPSTATPVLEVKPTMEITTSAIPLLPSTRGALFPVDATAVAASVSVPASLQAVTHTDTLSNATSKQPSLFTGISTGGLTTATSHQLLTLPATRTLAAGTPAVSMLALTLTSATLGHDLPTQTTSTAELLPSQSPMSVTAATPTAATAVRGNGTSIVESLLPKNTTSAYMTEKYSTITPETNNSLTDIFHPAITHSSSSTSSNIFTTPVTEKSDTINTKTATAFIMTGKTKTTSFTTNDKGSTTGSTIAIQTTSVNRPTTDQITSLFASQSTNRITSLSASQSTSQITSSSPLSQSTNQMTTSSSPISQTTSRMPSSPVSQTTSSLFKPGSTGILTTRPSTTTTTRQPTTTSQSTTTTRQPTTTTRPLTTTTRSTTTARPSTTTTRPSSTSKTTPTGSVTKSVPDVGSKDDDKEVTTSSPNSWTATFPEPSSEPEAEDLPLPPFAEPVPEWDSAMAAWSWAWEFHIYSIGCLFALLAIYSLVSLVRLRSRRLLSRGYFFALNLIMLVMGLIRAVYMLADAYNYRGLLPQVAHYLLLSTGFPCLTSAFSILFLALLQSTRMQLVSPRIQHNWVIAATVIAHFALSLTTDVLVGHFHKSLVLLFVCQAVFALWGLVLFLGYLYVFRRLYLATVYRLKEMKRMSLHKAISALPGIKPLRKRQKTSLGTAVKITLATALFGLACCGLQIYGMVHVYGLDGHTDPPQPWPWWIFQYTFRLCELGMCFTMSYVATQPFRYGQTGRPRQGEGGCLARLCPCCRPQNQHRLRGNYPSYDYSQAFGDSASGADHPRPHGNRYYDPLEAYPLRAHNDINDFKHHREKGAPADGGSLREGALSLASTPGASSRQRTTPTSDYNLADLFPPSRSHSGKSTDGDQAGMEFPGPDPQRSQGLLAGEGAAGFASSPDVAKRSGGCAETAFLMPPPANNRAAAAANSSSLSELSKKKVINGASPSPSVDPLAALGNSDWSLGMAMGYWLPPAKETAAPMLRSRSVDQQTDGSGAKNRKMANAVRRSASESRPDQRDYKALPPADPHGRGVKGQAALGDQEPGGGSLASLESETSQTESAVVANYDKISLRSDTIEL